MYSTEAISSVAFTDPDMSEHKDKLARAITDESAQEGKYRYNRK